MRLREDQKLLGVNEEPLALDTGHVITRVTNPRRNRYAYIRT